MEAELSGMVFEWLLADWAGYGNDPGNVFPSLRDIDPAVLNDELFRTIQEARLARKVV